MDHDHNVPVSFQGFKEQRIAFSWGDQGGFLEEVGFTVDVEVGFELAEMEGRGRHPAAAHYRSQTFATCTQMRQITAFSRKDQ